MTRKDTPEMPTPVLPSRYPESTRAIFAAFAHHGKPLRGLMSTPKSPSFQGRFGRMFRSLPAATYGKTHAGSRTAYDGPGRGHDLIIRRAEGRL